MERMDSEKERLSRMELLLDDILNNSEVPGQDRNFIIIKTIHSCQVFFPRHEFWPLEISMSVFNLRDGMKCSYWTLIDTVKYPVGHFSAAKETSEEMGLPLPGCKEFEGKHRDYKNILMNVKKFIEKFLSDYEHKYVVFAIDLDDIKSADGCLQWLADHAKLNEEEASDVTEFINKLEFVELPRLLLKFACLAKRRNRKYKHEMALDNSLVKTAESVLTNPCYNFNRDITCKYHTKDGPSFKMNVCTKNVVVRMTYLILEEIVPAMLIEMKDGHDIEKYAIPRCWSQYPILPGQYMFTGASTLPHTQTTQLTNKPEPAEE